MKSLAIESCSQFPDRFKSIQEKMMKVLNHPLVVAAQEQNQFSLDSLKRSIPNLKQYILEQEECKRCTGLENCPNRLQGYCSEPYEYQRFIDLQAKKCKFLEMHEQIQRRSRLIKSHSITGDILKATFEQVTITKEEPLRAKALAQVLEYCKLFVNDTPMKGLYLYGNFGCGKSFLAGSLANFLADRGVHTFMVHVPAFLEAIKGTFKEGTTQELIEYVKEVPVLILDDIGAESLSQWSRDDVIGNVLQARMKRKPTIYTSNLTLDELENHFSNVKGSIDKLKAGRIMERIRHYVTPIHVQGRNRRKDVI
jgi:primosomal protein DnaI